MENLDPKVLSEMIEKLQKGTMRGEEFAKQLGTLGKDFQKFGNESLKRVTDSLSRMEREVKSGEKRFKDLGSDLRFYNKQLEEQRIQAQEETDTTERRNKLAKIAETQEKINVLAKKAHTDALINGARELGPVLVKGLYDYYKKQVMVGIRGLQGDGSPFQLAADLQTAAYESAATAASGFSKVANTTGQALMMIPNPASMVVGALLQVGSGILESGAREAAELLKFKLEVVSKELEKSYKSFQQATAAGALFAGGMTELRQVGLAAGLTQEQFSKAIADNSSALASFGGDVTAGAKKLSGVLGKLGEGTNSYRKQLLNLGVSVEEQTQGTADYMAMLQRTGNLRGKTDEQLAEESKNYLVQMKAIASFTGEDAKKAEARAKQAAAQGAVAAKLQDLGPEAAAKFNAAIKLLPETQQKAAQQMLAFGTIVDSELAQTLGSASQNLLTGVIDDVKDSSIAAGDAQQRFYKNLDVLAPALQEEGKQMASVFGTVALATGNYANQSQIASDILTLANKNLRKTAEDITNTVTPLDKATAALNTQDSLTQKVGESVTALQNMRTAIQEDLTNAIKDFANDVPEILKGFRDKLKAMGLLEDKTAPKQNTARKDYNAKGDTVEDIVARTKIPESKITNDAKERATAVHEAEVAMQDRHSRRAEQRKRNQEKLMDRRDSSYPDEVGAEEGHAKGGIASGPLSGYKSLLHGTEAVIPLPSGDSIPVSLNDGDWKQSLANTNDRLVSMMESIPVSLNDGDWKQSLANTNDRLVSMMESIRDLVSQQSVDKSPDSLATVLENLIGNNINNPNYEKQDQMVKLLEEFVNLSRDSTNELRDQTSALRQLYNAMA